MMRSQYADDEAETFVEYTFAYRDGQYTIRRNPEYMRAGKRKNADGKIRLVKETSKVSLIMPYGKEFQGKKREVDQKIEQIIGLDAGQFTQIAMIAQGDFLRLLHAESKERKKIFSKIFQTQIYRDVQEQLKEQGKALYIQLKENEADIRREMERVDADGSKVQKVWEDLISQEMPSAEAVTETLGRILKEGKEAYETMEAEETALRKESEQLHLMIGKKEEINRIFGLLERTESEYKRLQEQSAEYELLKNHVVRDLLTRIPACLRKLVLLQPDLIVPIQFCKKSDHLRISKCPRLTLEIADIFNFQPDFLHHFAADGLFKCLSDLDKSSDQRIPTVGTVVDAVARHKKFVPVRDRHDNCRGDLWIFRLTADRADERPLVLAVLRLCPAASAKLTALSPAPQLHRRDRCKCLVHRLHRTDVG